MLSDGVALDGELVAFDDDGLPSFESALAARPSCMLRTGRVRRDQGERGVDTPQTGL
jgi:ATP-dependent DNA ligase